jgi:hypothetical protein
LVAQSEVLAESVVKMFAVFEHLIAGEGVVSVMGQSVGETSSFAQSVLAVGATTRSWPAEGADNHNEREEPKVP